jgi:hypothetical protein
MPRLRQLLEESFASAWIIPENSQPSRIPRLPKSLSLPRLYRNTNLALMRLFSHFAETAGARPCATNKSV